MSVRRKGFEMKFPAWLGMLELRETCPEVGKRREVGLRSSEILLEEKDCSDEVPTLDFDCTTRLKKMNLGLY